MSARPPSQRNSQQHQQQPGRRPPPPESAAARPATATAASPRTDASPSTRAIVSLPAAPQPARRVPALSPECRKRSARFSPRSDRLREPVRVPRPRRPPTWFPASAGRAERLPAACLQVAGSAAGCRQMRRSSRYSASSPARRPRSAGAPGSSADIAPQCRSRPIAPPAEIHTRSHTAYRAPVGPTLSR